MKREYLIAIIVLVLIGVGGFVWIGRNQDSQVSTPRDNATNENTIFYTNSGYSPGEITIETGTTVTFVNQSDLPMWTASNPHPVHTDYAEFDHRRGVGRSETYEFTFTEPGTFEYHNHLSPQHKGMVMVE